MPEPIPPIPASAEAATAAALAALRAAAMAGDLDAAARQAAALLAQRTIADPLPARVLAAWHEAAGRLPAAAQAFARALALDRDHGPTLTAYGLVRARLGQLVEAEGALRHAVAVAPEDPHARHALGWTLENRGEVEAALAEYAAAARLDPGHVGARSGAATLAARRGRWAEVRAQAAAALALAPDDAAATLALARADLGEGRPDAALARLEGWLATPAAGAATATQSRAVAAALIGDAQLAQDQPEAAFAAWRQANASLRALHADHFRDAPPPAAGAAAGLAERGRSLARRLLDAPLPPPPANGSARAQPPMPAVGHAFIVGFPRSGTTLLGQVLGAHPAVTTLDEVELLSAPATRWLADAASITALATAPDAALDDARQAYWRAVEQRVGPLAGRVFIDKLPTYLLALPLLVRLFPAARFIVVRRDPRDTVLSAFRHQFVVNPATFECLDLDDCAAFFDLAQRQAQRWLAALAPATTIAPHERLVTDFDTENTRLCAFLGLAPDAAQQRFAEAAARASVRTVSSVQVTRGLNRDGFGVWRRHRAALAGVLPILAPWVEAWGYPPD